MNDIAIKVKNLSKCYQIYDKPHQRLLQGFLGSKKQYFKEFWALKDVSFEIKKGETVGIIGRNGSGKSTLLQMICGTLTPTLGTVETHGRVAALLELGSGFNPEFTGRENVYMNAAVLGLSQAEIDARYEDIVAFAGIGEFVEQPVKTYSSGMLVRLAFAVAINVEPEILIVDEALSVGDEVFQRKCFSRIESIKKNGATILFVSHSGSTIVELCNRAILLDAGEQLVLGRPKIIIGQYQKLIYAPLEKLSVIRDEIINSELHDVDNKLMDIASEINELNGSINESCEEFFDENLQPSSIYAYESKGAFISSARIVDFSDQKVNCLKRGKRYRYLYNVTFDQGATNVRFGMLIKTITGLELGGAVSAPSVSQSIAYIAPNTTVKVEFQFTCHLNPDSYFLNAGVTGATGTLNEETYLHRILDICMFKVMPIMGNISTATIDFNCIPEISILNS